MRRALIILAGLVGDILAACCAVRPRGSCIVMP